MNNKRIFLYFLLILIIFSPLISPKFNGGRAEYLSSSNILINIRRDIRDGIPYGSAHSAGISSIVWGIGPPDSILTLTLTRTTSEVVTRTVNINSSGNFIVSMDRLIADGDVIQVLSTSETFVVPVPSLTFQFDVEANIITGYGPSAITSTIPESPHSLTILLGGVSRQVTTTDEGYFSVSFSDIPSLIGLLGSIRYTTPQGHNIYKPMFIVDTYARGLVGDAWADVVLGQPNFSQITPNQVVGNRVFNPGGVYIDRSIRWCNIVSVKLEP